MREHPFHSEWKERIARDARLDPLVAVNVRPSPDVRAAAHRLSDTLARNRQERTHRKE